MCLMAAFVLVSIMSRCATAQVCVGRTVTQVYNKLLAETSRVPTVYTSRPYTHPHPALTDTDLLQNHSITFSFHHPKKLKTK